MLNYLSEVVFYVVIPLIFLIIIFILWEKYGKDEKIHIFPNLYPPNISSLELSYIINGKLNKKDIKHYILYLGSKGYINVVRKKGKLKLIKMDTECNTKIENYFFSELFEDDKKIDLNSDLNKSKMFKIIKKIEKQLEIIYDIDNVFEQQSLTKKTLSKFMIIMIFIITCLKFLIDINNVKIFVLIFISACLGMKTLVSFIQMEKVHIKIVTSIISILLIFGPITLFAQYISDINYIIFFLINLFLIYIMVIFNILMPKKKTNLVKINEQLEGFKLFVLGNSRELKGALQTDRYYYDILPYMFALNLQQRWIQLGKENSMSIPNWYDTDSDFNLDIFLKNE